MSLALCEVFMSKNMEATIIGTTINNVTISFALITETINLLSLYTPSKNIPPMDVSIAHIAIIIDEMYNPSIFFCFILIPPTLKFLFTTNLLF